MASVADVRRAAPADVAAIRLVARLSWEAAYADAYSPDYTADFLAEAYAPDLVERAVRDPHAVFLVATVAADRGNVVAFVHAAPRERGWELLRLYALPERWRTGVGTALLDALESELRDRGVTRYGCAVVEANRVGRAFYAKRGFVETERRDGEIWVERSIAS